jgi:hypothetical protein
MSNEMYDVAVRQIDRLESEVERLRAVLRPRLKAEVLEDLREYSDITEHEDLGVAIRLMLEWYERGRAALDEKSPLARAVVKARGGPADTPKRGFA